MKFDLFGAMKILKYNFGDDVELIIRNFDMQYEITIRAFPPEFVPVAKRNNKEQYSYRFYVEFHEVASDNYCKIFNLKFKEAVEHLKEFIKEAENVQRESEKTTR